MFFLWELAEMLRRFLLVGLFVIVKPGQMIQLALGATVCAASASPTDSGGVRGARPSEALTLPPPLARVADAAFAAPALPLGALPGLLRVPVGSPPAPVCAMRWLRPSDAATLPEPRDGAPPGLLRIPLAQSVLLRASPELLPRR